MTEKPNVPPIDGNHELPSQRELTLQRYGMITTPIGVSYVAEVGEDGDLDNIDFQRQGASRIPLWEIQGFHHNGFSSAATLRESAPGQYSLALPKSYGDQFLSAFIARPSERSGYWEVEQIDSSATVDFATERLIIVPSTVGNLEGGKVLVAASLEGDLDEDGIKAIAATLINEGLVQDPHDLQGVQFGVIKEISAPTLPLIIYNSGDWGSAIEHYLKSREVGTDSLTSGFISRGSGEVVTREASDTRLLDDDCSAEAALAHGYHVAAATNVGGRDNQEDGASFLQVADSSGNEIVLLQAIDGMGGHEDGQVARELVIGTAAGTFEHLINEGVTTSLQDTLAAAATQADNAVKAYNDTHHRNNPYKPGAAGVMAAVDLRTGRFATFNKGDSRLYMLTSRELTQVTTDHSQAESEIQRGLWDRKHHRTHPRLNYIQSAFGDGDLEGKDLTTAQIPNSPPNTNFPYMHEGVLPPNGRLLLCSDGVWDVLGDEEIQQILTKAKTPAAAAQNIIAAVKATKKPHLDNITAVVLFGPESDTLEVTPDGRLVIIVDPTTIHELRFGPRRPVIKSGPLRPRIILKVDKEGNILED